MIFDTKQIRIVDIDKLIIFPQKRDCFDEIIRFADHDGGRGKICALYGLRRTGKTVLLNQVAKEMSDKGYKCLYLECSDEIANIKRDSEFGVPHIPEMSELFELLDMAIKEGYEIVLIDELTFAKDLIGQGNVLANYYASQGLTIIATGTDSLSFVIASRDDMYDRIVKIRTSYVSFQEYSRILGKSIDEYIEFGGTLASESPYKTNSSRIEYTNNAIVKNIVQSIKNSAHLDGRAITNLYSEKDIISTINRCVDQMNQLFVISAINNNGGLFESHPLHLSIANTKKSFPYLEYLNIFSLDNAAKDTLFILNRDEMETTFEQSDVDLIYKALAELDLVLSIPTYLSIRDNYTIANTQILTQPGMMYCHATNLIELLCSEQYWRDLDVLGDEKRDEFKRRIERQVKGSILENLVLFDTFRSLNENYFVTKLHLRYSEKEVDMVVTDRKTYETYLFEVKYSEHSVSEQCKNLISTNLLEYVEREFGHIAGKYVIYNGKNCVSNEYPEIKYINSEKYLDSIAKADNIKSALSLCGFDDFVKT